MKAPTKCPHCGHKPKPLPNPKRERLKDELWRLSSEARYLDFETGRAFEQEQTHRLALLAIFKTSRKLEREQKRLRLKIATVEKPLRGS